MSSKTSTILLITLIFLISGCSTIQTQKENGHWYQFKKGDTIENIAKKFSLDPLEIQRENQIYDTDDVTIGMKIFIPGVRKVKSRKPEAARITRRSDTGKMVWPSKGTLSSGYGMRHGRMHQGVDLTRDKGKDIVASGSGIVKFAGNKKGFGKTIIIDHGNGLSTLYAHSEKIYVSKGEEVKQGKLISKMGSTGKSTGIHLHFEIHKNGVPQNPLRYLAVR
ncbi:MAG: LysM peptidoglycan-binding domain-containing M23 family metallopeptidase [Proteobacteria bacterium]|nr:LysM peptidoglycan-binding domain-containing M23 family metallopeptidase [Pseudomonadota bacterium]